MNEALPTGALYGFFWHSHPSRLRMTIQPGSCRDETDSINMEMRNQVEITLPPDTGSERHVYAVSGSDGAALILATTDGDPAPGEYRRKLLTIPVTQ